MSGHKKLTVTISQDEYRRLHEAEIQMRFQKTELPESVKQMIQEIKASGNQSRLLSEGRQQAYKEISAGFHREISQLEADHSRKLISLQNEFQQELNGRDNLVGGSIQQVLDDQSRRFDNLMKNQMNQAFQVISSISNSQQYLESRIDDLNLTLQDFQQSQVEAELHKEGQADVWFQAASTTADFIQENYDLDGQNYQRFINIYRSLQIAEDNINQRAFEAGMAVSQQSYMQLSTLRMELEQAEFEWNILRRAALEQLTILKMQVENFCQIQAVDLTGQEVDQVIDVDYWTQGAWHILERETDNLLQSIESRSFSFTINDLQDILNNQIPSLEERAKENLVNARWEVINSQLRINIADLVIQALRRQGFSAFTADYTGGDMRTSFATRLKDLEGNEIEVHVTPSRYQQGESNLHLLNIDRNQRTEREIMQRTREVTSMLSKYGLNITSLKQLKSAPVQEKFRPGTVKSASPTPAQVEVKVIDGH